MRQFLSLPFDVHRGDAGCWIPPITLHMRSLMGRIEAPDRRFLLAVRDGRAVARIGVKIHHDALHFGFFECHKDTKEAVGQLIEDAHALAPHLPMRGPFHFTLEDPYTGLLVDGFDRPPCFLMPYNPPWYAEHLEHAGLRPIKALYAYEFDPQKIRYSLMASRAETAVARGVRVRFMDRRRVKREVRAIADIFEDALCDNWGFEPFNASTLADLEFMARFVPEKWGVMLASVDGKDVGCLIVVPNFNELIADLRGRLHPALLWRYLRRQRRIQTYRGYALGVRKDYQDLPVAAALVHTLLQMGQGARWHGLEVGWILEDNQRMNVMARALGGRRSKVYHVLERSACSQGGAGVLQN